MSAFAHDGEYSTGGHPQTKALRCNVIGLKPLKQFAVKREALCFTSDLAATSNGYAPYPSTKRSRRARVAVACRALGVTGLGFYFTKNQTHCFGSRQEAHRAGFTRFVARTPTPTPIAQLTSTPTTTGQPTPTRTPLPTPISDDLFVADPSATWNVTLADPDGLQTGETGECQAAFNAERTLFRYACTTNVTSHYEAHVEVTGGTLGKWCMVPFDANGNTSQSFSRICRVDAQYDGVNAPPPLTDADWRDMILGSRTSSLTGQKIRAFISVHRDKGAENEEINGYITPP